MIRFILIIQYKSFKKIFIVEYVCDFNATYDSNYLLFQIQLFYEYCIKYNEE
jgi:hypothetical protein